MPRWVRLLVAELNGISKGVVIHDGRYNVPKYSSTMFTMENLIPGSLLSPERDGCDIHTDTEVALPILSINAMRRTIYAGVVIEPSGSFATQGADLGRYVYVADIHLVHKMYIPCHPTTTSGRAPLQVASESRSGRTL